MLEEIKICAEKSSVDKYPMPGGIKGEQLNVLDLSAWVIADPDEYLAHRYCIRHNEDEDWVEFWNWPKQQLLFRAENASTEATIITRFLKRDKALEVWRYFLECAQARIWFIIPRRIKI